jgi:hypothetical protein
MRPYPGKRRNRMSRLVVVISTALLLSASMRATSANEVRGRRTPPKITPLVVEYSGYPRTYKKNMLIEACYESVGGSPVKVYLTKKHLSDKKAVWKTLLYTANYYLVSLHCCDKGQQYICAQDERHETYYIDVDTGRRIERP